MAWLKAYERERARWPEYRVTCSKVAASTALVKLFRHFKVPLAGVHIQWTSGRRNHRGGANRIVLNLDYLCLGSVIHEVSHCIQARRGNRGHNDVHWAIMMELYDWATAQRWHLGVLEPGYVEVQSVGMQTIAVAVERLAAEKP